MYMWGTFDLSVQGHFDVIWCTCLKIACNLLMAGRRAEQIEICDLWIVVTCILGTFDL